MADNSTGQEWEQYVGPGGEVVTVIMIFLPILFVVVATLIPHPLPTTVSLPLSALLMYIVRLAYLASDPINTTAALLSGIPEVMTPVTIVCGAIYLFNIMEATGCMPWIMRELKILSKGHPVAEFMLIGYCFAYLVEGASGFGTPAALSAPMLAQLGHNPTLCVVAVLLTNTMATVFGAVGTPIWYGLGSVVDTYYPGEEAATLTEIGFQAGCALCFGSLILPLMAAMYLIPFKVLFKNIIFFYLSLMSVMVPMLCLSLFTYEFPTILGGIIGLCITAVMVTFKLFLPDVDPDMMGEEWQMMNQRGCLWEESQGTAGHAESTVDFATENESKKDLEGDMEEHTDSLSVQSEQRSRRESIRSAIEATTAAVTITHAVESAFDPEAQVDDEGNKLEDDSISRPSFSDIAVDGDEQPVYKLKPRETGGKYVTACLLRTFPLTGTVVLLILTRLPMLPLKGWLTTNDPNVGVQLGTLMYFQISASLKMLFNDILGDTTVSSKYETLYVPGILPFFVISWIACIMFWKDMREMRTNPIKELGILGNRVASAAIALLGGLMLVGLIRNGGYGSPAYLLGSIVSGWVGGWWFVLAPFLGALGSFFSGSTAVSCLTFGEVQYVAAVNSGYNPTTILAMQAFGASIGNAICINNVIAARTVIGLTDVGEGVFIKKTGPVAFITIVWVTVLMYCCFVLPGEFHLDL
ncbi:hypothetical protein SARC_00251 [Sphaeroforma arctica JP610]|uniref:Lactate permease n=1 Tax=Sphaeroforma arctica JP610 TaxID=667725 RepID=A0A0L0GF12_9EUKA|nr:hypothetical protein SARC_00251 [Sphaeroforma arctica JP610]KNC87620.1 hypothetical protein SARC_00251 [Sphaeroforma arctica JP610]|eukprot:XP_014161522.1 hypothetical protein SARC_00251 [Sphaeroforma arctica JP610]